MTELLKQIPKWASAIALLLFVIALFVPVFQPQFRLLLYEKKFGFVRTPPWTVTAEIPDDGYSEVDLGVSADEGVCFLTYVGGGFSGRSENVHVYVSGNQWKMKNTAGNGNADLHSKAACVKFAVHGQ